MLSRIFVLFVRVHEGNGGAGGQIVHGHFGAGETEGVMQFRTGVVGNVKLGKVSHGRSP